MVDSKSDSNLVDAVQLAAEGRPLSEREADVLLQELFMPVIRNTFIRHRFFEDATGLTRNDLIGELWQFSSTPGPRTGKALWRKALDTMEKRGIARAEQGSPLKAYLLRCYKRHITALLMKKSSAEAMVSLIAEACKREKAIELAKDPKGSYFASIRPISEPGSRELPELNVTDLEALLPDLSIPVPKSTRSTLVGAVFPTPTQVVEVMRQVFVRSPGVVLVSDFSDFLFTAFRIPRQAVNVSIEGDSGSEDSGGETDPAQLRGEELKNISTVPAHLQKEKDALIPQYARNLLDEIAEIDKVAVSQDDPASGGKIARILLDFLLWQGAVREDDPSVRFGYEVYAKIASTRVSTLNDRKNKLVQLLEDFVGRHQLTCNDVKSVFSYLREHFSARKPENFTDPRF